MAVIKHLEAGCTVHPLQHLINVGQPISGARCPNEFTVVDELVMMITCVCVCVLNADQ